MTHDFLIRLFEPQDHSAVIKIWHECNLVTTYNDPEQDIERAQRFDNAKLLVGEIKGQIIATAFISHDGRRGWLYLLAVRPQYRGCGFARQLIDEALSWTHSLGLIKLNLAVRTSNAKAKSYYEKLGFHLHDCDLMYAWTNEHA